MGCTRRGAASRSGERPCQSRRRPPRRGRRCARHVARPHRHRRRLGGRGRGRARRGVGGSRRRVAAGRPPGARLAARVERARRGDRARRRDRRLRGARPPPVCRCARTCAAQQGGVAELLDAIIGSAVRVSTWVDAIDVAIANPHAVVVTDDGDRFGPAGWRVGVASGGATASALEEAQERLGIATAELEGRTRAEQMARVELRGGASTRGRAQPPARHPRRRFLGELRCVGPRSERASRHRRPSWRRLSTPSARPTNG